jgi:hypothetical protein
MEKVFVVILNWNRTEDTLQCLKSVKSLKKGDYIAKVAVIDNGSDPKLFSELKRNVTKLNFPPNILRLIRNEKNLGFAAGNNVGIEYSLKNEADYILILNNDTVVDTNLINSFLEAGLRYPDGGIFSPKIYFAPGFEFHKNAYHPSAIGKVIWSAGGEIDWKNVYGKNRGVDEVDRGQYDSGREIDYATGACMFVRSEVFEKIGLFDEKYFMYKEDEDFSLRAKKAGFKVVYTPSSYLWHKVARSSAIGSELNDYFIARNRMLFGMQYAKVRTKLALLRESIRLLVSGRKWQKVGIRDYYLGNFGKGNWR